MLASRLAFAAGDLGVALRLRQDDRAVAVGLGLDQLRPLEPLGAKFLGLALALRFHPVVDRLAGLQRQVGAMQPHFRDLDAERREFGAHFRLDVLHHFHASSDSSAGRLMRPNSRRIAVFITWANCARASARLRRLW